MPARIHLSEVQSLNLSFLLAFQSAYRQNPAAACCRFAVSAETGRKIDTYSYNQLHEIVVRFGQECLLQPREELFQLLEAPSGIVALLATARLGPRTA